MGSGVVDFIIRDIDGHNGGAWKRASSGANLSSKQPEQVRIMLIYLYV
jgi:hypothetical protein